MKKKILLVSSLALMATSVLGSEVFDLETFKISLKNTPHKIKLINSGLASLEERLEMLERAKESIDIEYFIYNSDLSGKIFTQALIKKAREGVKIRVLLDTVMIKSLITPYHIYELQKEGIEVKYFNNTALLNLVKGMYRNHRKLLIIDGKEVITGGRNIGDEYFDLREDFNFLDREILIEGDIVKTIKNSFEVLWKSKVSVIENRPEKPDENDFKYRNDDSGVDSRYESDLYYWNKKVKKAQDFLSPVEEGELNRIRTKGRELLDQSYEGICKDISFSSEFPMVTKKNREFRIIKKEIYSKIAKAKSKVVFDSPYFIVDKESKDALNQALDNNVKVEVLTNGLNSTDAIYVYDVFKSIIKKWINKGIETFTFKGERPKYYDVLDEKIAKARFGVHAKTFVIDDSETIIGTYNFDPRSANYNAEMVVGCENNPELAKVVTEDIQKREEGSFKLDTAEKVDDTAFYKVSFLKRIGYGLLKIPANLFDYLL